MAILIVVSVIFVFVLLVVAGMYNALVRIRNHCEESWSDIDTEMQRRYDLIPNLVNTVKGYARHERELLEEVTRMRQECVADHGSPKHQAASESLLQAGLAKLMVRLEAYPDLKANKNFLELQRELTNTENRIQAANRFYNGNVRDNNNRVQMFPSNIMLVIFGFKEKEYFELQDESARVAPKSEF